MVESNLYKPVIITDESVPAGVHCALPDVYVQHGEPRGDRSSWRTPAQIRL